MQPDDINLSDAILLALHERGWLRLSLGPRETDALVFDDEPDHEPYTPTLPGVRYDRAQHRLHAQVNRTVNGVRKRYYVGSGPCTWEEEQRLSARWAKMDAAIPRGTPGRTR